jgi:hypothetical protein
LKEVAVRLYVLVSVFALMANAETALANDTVTVVAPNGSAAQPNGLDQVVCQNGPAPTGSRIGATRECHTQREWDRMRQEQRHVIETHQTMIGSGGH